jgi:DNA-binding MarR family transcriptional regulator
MTTSVNVAAPARVNIPGLVFRLGSEVRTVFDRRVARFDLTMQQVGLLLHCTDPMTPAQIAPILGTDTAGMTRLADRLEARGLVRRRRNPADRRSILLEPTPAAKAIIPELRRIFRATARELVHDLSPSEQELLAGLLGRVAANARAASEHI